MRLALFELRRFTRAPITVAALVVLTLVPLLYGALYLWAFWDPYGNMHHIPVGAGAGGPAGERPTAGRCTRGGTSPTSWSGGRSSGGSGSTRRRRPKGLRDGSTS